MTNYSETTYPIDLLRDNNSDWLVVGFPYQLEGEWKSLEGKELAIKFISHERSILRLRFSYFSAIDNQSGLVKIDGNEVMKLPINEKGLFWRDFLPGEHEILFKFAKTRPTDFVKGDGRPLSAAFTELRVERMTPSQKAGGNLFIIGGSIILTVMIVVFLSYFLRVR